MVDSSADRRCAAIDDEIDAAAQVGEHMGGGGRRDVTGTVGRRRHDRPGERRQDFLRHRVLRHAHGDAVEPGRGQCGDTAAARLRQHQRQRPRPERRGEPRRIGVEARQRRRGGTIGDVGDQRIEGRPALGFIEAGDGEGVGRIGAEAVNRLRRERHEAAALQAAHRIADRGGVGSRHAGRRRDCHGDRSVPK